MGIRQSTNMKSEESMLSYASKSHSRCSCKWFLTLWHTKLFTQFLRIVPFLSEYWSWALSLSLNLNLEDLCICIIDSAFIATIRLFLYSLTHSTPFTGNLYEPGSELSIIIRLWSWGMKKSFSGKNTTPKSWNSICKGVGWWKGMALPREVSILRA